MKLSHDGLLTDTFCSRRHRISRVREGAQSTSLLQFPFRPAR